MAYKRKSKKIRRQVDTVIAHVRSTFNNIRSANNTPDMEFIPVQFGGLFGQNEVLDKSMILEITEFEVSE